MSLVHGVHKYSSKSFSGAASRCQWIDGRQNGRGRSLTTTLSNSGDGPDTVSRQHALKGMGNAMGESRESSVFRGEVKVRHAVCWPAAHGVGWVLPSQKSQ